VASIALCGLVVALVLPPLQSDDLAGVFFLIFLVVLAWKMFRVVSEGPSCEECGRRFMPPRRIASRTLCPQCGQRQPGLGGSRKALVIGFGAVLALLFLVVVLIRLQQMDLIAFPGLFVSQGALAIVLAMGTMLVAVLFSDLLVEWLPEDSDRFKPGPCEKCGSNTPPRGATGPLICARCRLRRLPKEQSRRKQARATFVALVPLLIVGLIAGFMLTDSVSSHFGMNYRIALPLVIVATMVGLWSVLIVARV